MDEMLDFDEFFLSKVSKSHDTSAIMLTLSSRLSYDDAKLVEQYKNWKKLT